MTSEPHVGEGGAAEEVKGDVSESLMAIAPALRSVNEALSMSANVVKSIEDAEEDWARFNHPTALNPVKTARSALEVAIGTSWWKLAMATPIAQLRKKVKEEANAGILQEIQAPQKPPHS